MKTKKLLAILIAVVMVFALLPASLFAAGTVNVTGSYTGVESNTIYHGDGTASADYVNITLIEDLVLDGSTFENGAILQVAAEGHNVTIKNCKFYDHVGGGATSYNYACAIENAGNVTIENNIVSGSWRAFNVSISSSASKLTATGNSITLTKITELGKEEKNVGIQVHGGNWLGANISIYGNTFVNATTAFRLHNSFAFASGHGNDVIYLGKNTVINVDNIAGKDPDPELTSEAQQAAVTTALSNINTIATAGTAGTDVTANAGVTYTVIIPSSVNFGTIYQTMPAQSRNFPITVQDTLLESGKKITVAKTSTVDSMSDGKGNVLAFTFTPATEGFVFASNGTQTGSVSCTPASLEAAGSYSGYMTFSVTYGS